MKITIETIEHSAQRYPTVGDWYWNDAQDELTVKVSKLPVVHEGEAILLIGVHELIEALLCRRGYIPEWEVDRFDMEWQPHDGLIEPGDDPHAPYHNQHVFASNIERIIAQRLGINWQRYEEEIAQLS